MFLSETETEDLPLVPLRQLTTMNKESKRPKPNVPLEEDSMPQEVAESNAGVVIAPPKPINPVPEGEDGEDGKPVPALLAARRLKQSRQLPEVPGRKPTWDQANAWMALLTPDQWSRILVYLYRVFPIIVRQLSDKDNSNYIDKFGSPFTEQEIIANHGGGKYRLVYSDMDREGQTAIMEATLDVPMGEYKPKLDYREIDRGRKENTTYLRQLRIEGILNEHGEIMENKVVADRQTATANLSEATLAKMMDRMFSMYEKLTDPQKQEFRREAQSDPAMVQMFNMVTKQNEKNLDMIQSKLMSDSKEPSAMAGVMEKFLTLFTTLLTKKGDGDGGVSMMQVLQMQQDSHKSQMELMKMVVESKQQQQEGGGKFSELRDVVALLKDLKEDIGGGEGEGRSSGKRGLWETAMEYGFPVLNNLLILGNNAIAVRAKVAGMPVVSIDNAGLKGVKVPQGGGGPGAETQTTIQPALPPGTEQTTTTTVADGTKSGLDPSMVIKSYGGMILGALGKGQDGYEFCEYVVGLFGMQPHAIVEQMGVEALLQAAKAIPEFWVQASVFGEEKLRMFITEFIEFPTLPPEGDDEDGDEPEPILVVGKGKKGKVGKA